MRSVSARYECFSIIIECVQDIDSMRKRVAEMEQEAEKLRALQGEMEKKLNTSVVSSVFK